jgi:hypothetical protein
MQAIAARLGFRLLSTRLELFGARLDANDAAAPIPAQAPTQPPTQAPAQAPAAARARPQASEAVGRPAARAAPNGRAQR